MEQVRTRGFGWSKLGSLCENVITECLSYKKKVLKEIALFFLEKPVELDYTRQFHQWESFVLDISDTKLFKSKNVILLIKVWGH